VTFIIFYADECSADKAARGERFGAEAFGESEPIAISGLCLHGEDVDNGRRGPAGPSLGSLRIQADTFNLANHLNFGNPDMTFTNSTFGAISSSQPARNIQFGARFAF
jgi:hypothetical protein